MLGQPYGTLYNTRILYHKDNACTVRQLCDKFRCSVDNDNEGVIIKVGILRLADGVGR